VIRAQVFLIFVVVLGPFVGSAQAQLRIVSYNTLGNPTSSGDMSNWNVVLQAIGTESVNGIARRVGILALQEVDEDTDGQNAQNVANLLNSTYGVSSYQASIAPFGEGFNLQAFVYDSSQVDLLSTFSTDIGTRPTWRGRFRPVGYTSPAAEFYVYSSHFKAFEGFESTRNSEAALLRANGNNLGQGANIIYAGDYNFIGGASEPGYATMLASGNGQAIDPESGDFTSQVKKSYSSSSPVSRIDFQFVTNELEDDEGLDMVDGSYRVFGRVQRGQSVITSPSQLTSASDHLPVVADYQLPAMMHAELAAVPATLMQGEVFNLDLSVGNVAPVVAALGADELDYSLSVIGGLGGLLGEATGTDLALGLANLHQIALDTATPGVKSGTIQVTSNSPAVANGSFSFNVMFEVLAAALAGDYNNDGTIDAADYSVWRDVFGAEGAELLNDPTPGVVDENDFAYWREHFGESLPVGAGSRLAVVPEPSATAMFWLGVAVLVPGGWRCLRRQCRMHCSASCGLTFVALIGLSVDPPAQAVELRIATYNCTLSPDEPSGARSLPSRLAGPGDGAAERVAEVIQRILPDILLLNEFNWDRSGSAADEFAANYLSVGHDAAGTGTRSAPISFAFRYLPTGADSPFNTGVASGMDLDGNGRSEDAGDAFGYGKFPGQYGMMLLSKYPIVRDQVRTFQHFRWRDMPANLIPPGFYSDEELQMLPLSSKSHWDVPIDVAGHVIHVLASHPTPPVFDGDEDRNGRRNFDEIRFWRDYVTPGEGNYLYDDREFAAAGGRRPDKRAGGLSAGASFVIVGDQNADPRDGGSRPGAINQLFESPRVNATKTPTGSGGPQAAIVHGEKNARHASDPAYDTAAFGPSGNLRVDYVLPSADIEIVDSGVFWFTDQEPLHGLADHGTFPSDHRAVYVDVKLRPGDD